MAAVKRGLSVAAQFLPAATGSLYALVTAGASRGVITSAVMTANAAVNGVELYLVEAGGSVVAKNRILKKNFFADEEYTVPELIGQAVTTTGSVQGNDGGNGGATVNIFITVTEFTGDS